MTEGVIPIPWDALEADTLNAVIEEFITRHGTDYGAQEISLERKLAQVLAGLKGGHYLLLFDPDMGSTHIVTKAEWDALTG